MPSQVSPLLSLPPTIRLSLNYSSPPSDGSPAFTHVYEPEDGSPQTNVTIDPREMDIRDFREFVDAPKIDREGFEIIRNKLEERDEEKWNDEDWIKDVYYPEVEKLLKEHLGASRIILFDHTIRKNDPTKKERPGERQPVPRVHVDQSDKAAHNRVRLHAGEEDAEELLKKRVQIINVWRPLRGPVYDFPLAACDFSSMEFSKDTFPQARIAPERVGETLGVKFNPSHRWYYLSAQNATEAYLLKCWDSEKKEGIARMVPHTAFKAPHDLVPADSKPRHSIELRALVFY